METPFDCSLRLSRGIVDGDLEGYLNKFLVCTLLYSHYAIMDCVVNISKCTHTTVASITTKRCWCFFLISHIPYPCCQTFFHISEAIYQTNHKYTQDCDAFFVLLRSFTAIWKLMRKAINRWLLRNGNPHTNWLSASHSQRAQDEKIMGYWEIFR